MATTVLHVHDSKEIVVWKAEPSTRGTFTLLSTCIITLSLCVWSSVHLNLPGNDGSSRPNFLRRLSWILGALIAPEYLIMTAWGQRQAAKQISMEVEEQFNSQKKVTQSDPESQSLSRKHPWTKTHSFWAIMGGIAIDPRGLKPFIPRSERATLTRSGASFLIKHDPQLLPDISEEEVKDKSKGGSLTKSIACIQATWFCLSCIARVSQKLPVSMLELNVLAHSLCTILVYIIWWRKPLDIKQPLVIREDRMRPLLAYMWMASKTSCIPKPAWSESKSNSTIKVGRDPEFEAIIDDRASSEDAANVGLNHRQRSSDSVLPALGDLNTDGLSVRGPVAVTITTTQPLSGTGFRVNAKSTRWKETETSVSGDEYNVTENTITHYKPAVFNLTPCDVRRWELAREAMDKYQLKKPDTNLDLVTVKAIPESMGFDFMSKEIKALPFLGFSLVAAGYGGLHALAWNAQFPTHRELILWHMSALVVASPAALCVFFLVLQHAAIFAVFIFRFCHRKLARVPNPDSIEMSPPKPAVVKKRSSSQISEGITMDILIDILKGLGVLAAAAFMYLYIFARAYLVYESFRAVFFLPPEVYSVPRWTQYLPHIT